MSPMISWLRKLFRRPSQSGLTLSQVLPLFLASREAKGVRAKTLAGYACWAARATREHGTVPLACIDEALLLRIIDAHCRDEADYYLCLLRWAIRVGHLPPDHRLPRLPEDKLADKRRPAYMLAGDVRHFLAAVAEIDAAMLPAFILGFYGGLRPQECCRIRWQEITPQDERLRIETWVSKIRRFRLIQHCPPLLWQLLHPLAKSSGRVIPEKDETHANFRWIRVRREAAERAGIRLGHDIIRHTFATHLVALTGNVSITAHILGHQDLGMLSRHYDGVATRAEGMAYFDLNPDAAMRYCSATAAWLASQASTKALPIARP